MHYHLIENKSFSYSVNDNNKRTGRLYGVDTDCFNAINCGDMVYISFAELPGCEYIAVVIGKDTNYNRVHFRID